MTHRLPFARLPFARLPFALFCMAGAVLLSGCSLMGAGPKQHTVVDYESLEPEMGHGADYDEQTRYGRVSTTRSRTGMEKPTYNQGYTPDDDPAPEQDDTPGDTPSNTGD